MNTKINTTDRTVLDKIEELKRRDFSGFFANRMGGAHIRSVNYQSENNIFVVVCCCNIFGHGSQDIVITFNENLEQVY